MANKSTNLPGADPATSLPVGLDELAEIAHELRTPLGGIEAMAAMLANGPLSDGQRAAMDALLASVAHLRQVASGILGAHCGRTVSAGVLPCVVGLSDLVGHMATAARLRAEAKGLAFSVRLAEGLPEEILTAPTRLRQMIENLLDNAFKATQSGTVSLDIDRIERRGGEHLLRFAVRDSGPGFSAVQAEQIFEPFHRLDDRLPGAGIGLSLVKRFAQAMGGDVGAEAVEGQGAIVWFTVLARAAAEAASPDAPGSDKPPPCVLVVDDDLSSRMVMSVVLKQFGCEVLLAENGKQAMELVKARPLAAVMMDMSMAGMNGAETTRAIRKLGSPHAGVPVVAVTGRVGEGEQRLFAEAGASAFVPKPLSPRAVWAALREAGVFSPTQNYPLEAA